MVIFCGFLYNWITVRSIVEVKVYSMTKYVKMVRKWNSGAVLYVGLYFGKQSLILDICTGEKQITSRWGRLRDDCQIPGLVLLLKKNQYFTPFWKSEPFWSPIKKGLPFPCNSIWCENISMQIWFFAKKNCIQNTDKKMYVTDTIDCWCINDSYGFILRQLHAHDPKIRLSIFLACPVRCPD